MNARIDTAETGFIPAMVSSPQAERRAALQQSSGEAWQAGLLHRLGDALFGWVRRDRVRAELAALSDRDLSDMGITRGDFDRILTGPEAASTGGRGH